MTVTTIGGLTNLMLNFSLQLELQLSMDLSSWVRQLPLDHLSMWMREEEAREEVQLICLYQLL